MTSPADRPRSAARAFLTSEAAGGIALMAASAIAFVLANGPLAEAYHHIVHARTGPVLAPRLGPMTVHLWINDALMALFFLLVGLEIKRELVDGRLASRRQRRVPFIAAAAGMAAPAAVYLAVAGGDPRLASGWAIPAATDIAFAIGVLALLGSRAPAAIKLLLTTIAIVDDMGAVAIIAAVYTDAVDLSALGAAAAILAGMAAMNRAGVRALPLYLLGFAALWYALLLSGVHATIAGVLAAATIPFDRTPGAPEAAGSPLHRLEHGLAPLVGFIVVPLFGFANAGVAVAGADALLAPLPMAVACGLVLGKQAGVFGALWLSVRLGLAARPGGATWRQLYAMAALCGIGFTMSLFIAALAFPADPMLADQARVGILAGSLVSALIGTIVLRLHPVRSLA